MEWLNDKAAAIQAVSAIVIAALTLVLLIVTRRYVRATDRILQVSQRLVE